MISESPTITHPYDWFKKREIIKKDMCFLIMPFAPQFNLVYDVIKDALKNIMMGGVYRANDLETSPAILERILV